MRLPSSALAASLISSHPRAAVAYDKECVRMKGLEAVTNYDLAECESHSLWDALRPLTPSRHALSSDADVLSECLPGSASEIAGMAHAAAAASRSGTAALPGPAVSIEPSAEAMAIVAAVFARAPSLDAPAAAAAGADTSLMTDQAPAKRPRPSAPRPEDAAEAIPLHPATPAGAGSSSIPRRVTF